MSVRAAQTRSTPGDHPDPGNDLPALSERFEWQSILFAPEPARAALLRLRARWPLSPCRIRVHRNHAIESSLSVLRPFMEYGGFEPEFVVGDYDDSLTLSTVADADVEVIWLDFARLTDRLGATEIAAWLLTRVAALRARTGAPILILDWDGPRADAAAFSARLKEGLSSLGAVRLAEREELFANLGEGYFDEARRSATGTRMSRQAAVHTARMLGCRWLPALLEPRLKAVVVDLDNTLYDGVLGEDGSEGVLLTNAHAELQRQLLALRESGIFLGLLSRNELADVEALFRTRADFPLRWEDFSARSVGWQPKSEGLRSIARDLRIDTDSVLFVDDNGGELLETLQHVPNIRCMHAAEDPQLSASGLRFFPGLWAFDHTSEDLLRVADLRANDQRSREIAVAADDASYYRELGVQITVGHERADDLPRIAELSRKTNQFNLALRRYTEPQLRSMLTDERFHLSTLRLEDRLSDSGLIAMAVSERDRDLLLVHELCISCRALGRRLEDLIVAQLLSGEPGLEGALDVSFAVVDGPRNRPARSWLSEFAGAMPPAGIEPVQVRVPAQRLRAASVNPDVSITLLR